MTIARNKFVCRPAELTGGGPDPAAAAAWDGEGFVARPHLQNWMDCIESRRTPNATIETGHRTATVCHLANLVRELDRPLRWDPVAERFVDDEVANTLLGRPRRREFELDG